MHNVYLAAAFFALITVESSKQCSMLNDAKNSTKHPKIEDTITNEAKTATANGAFLRENTFVHFPLLFNFCIDFGLEHFLHDFK